MFNQPVPSIYLGFMPMLASQEAKSRYRWRKEGKPEQEEGKETSISAEDNDARLPDAPHSVYIRTVSFQHLLSTLWFLGHMGRATITTISIEIVPIGTIRGKPPFQLMKSRGRPPLIDDFQRWTPFGGLYVDEFSRQTPFWGAVCW